MGGAIRHSLLHAVVLAAVAVLLVPAAHAAFPGENGKILFDYYDDLWTMNPDGTGQSRLTDTPYQELDARWSADGTRIVHLNNFGFSSGVPEDFSVLNADGSLINRLEVPGNGEHPAWSPDGDRIAYDSVRFVCNQPPPYPCYDEPLGIRTIRSDGSADQGVLAEGDDPAWSPDGARIAFTDFRKTGFGFPDIWVANIDGTGVLNVTEATDSLSNTDLTPDWSPDGERIVFIRVVCAGGGSPCDPNWEVFTIRPDGTDLRQLTFTDNDEMGPIWSPDGTKILVNAATPNLSSSAGMFVMNADGTGMSRIHETASAEDWQAIVNESPDCSTVSAVPEALRPPNHRFVNTSLSGATDPDGEVVDLEITGVTQDEPVGSAPDAANGAAANQVRLRAERDGAGDGRVYRVAFRASDDRGGTCTGAVSVGVRKGSGAAVDSAPPSYDPFGS
jgi:dipeptidyl aminopeptidase/acylaminoacyl peptidase